MWAMLRENNYSENLMKLSTVKMHSERRDHYQKKTSECAKILKAEMKV